MTSLNAIKLPGEHTGVKTDICCEKKVSFKILTRLVEQKELNLPQYQAELNVSKVDEMIESYHKNPHYLAFKNKVVIGVIIRDTNRKYYILDGQHRIDMAHKIHIDKGINDNLIFCYYLVKTDDEMKELFNEINKDSLKIQHYMSLPELIRSEYIALKEYIKDNWSKYFSSTKKLKDIMYSIGDFIDELVKLKYFERQINFIKDIKAKNEQFYNLLDYKSYFDSDPDNFYKDEQSLIQDKFIMSLKKNNFIDFVINNTLPSHKFKNPRINKSEPEQRLSVWFKEFKENTGVCCVYKCKNKITNKLNGFAFGYIIAKNKNFNPNNIRPVCKSCEHKMKGINWIQYETDIKIELEGSLVL
jgi:hypothetical protein